MMRCFTSQPQQDLPIMNHTLNEPSLMELMAPLPLCAVVHPCFKPKEAQVQISPQQNPHYLCLTIQLQKLLHQQQDPCGYELEQGAALAAGRNICMILVPTACWRHSNLIVWHLRLHQTHSLVLFLPHPSAWIPPNLSLSSYRSSAKTKLNSKLGLFLHVLGVFFRIIWKSTFNLPEMFLPLLGLIFVSQDDLRA